MYTYIYIYMNIRLYTIPCYNRYASFVVLFLFLFLSCFFFVVLFRKSALCFVRLNYNRVLQMHRASVVHQESHCNTLQHTATHCNTHVPLVESILSASIQLRNSAASYMFVKSNALQHTAHTATHCNTLQHTATHCNTLQHTRTLGSVDLTNIYPIYVYGKTSTVQSHSCFIQRRFRQHFVNFMHVSHL